MSSQQNRKTIEDVYAAFGRGDVAFIINQLTNDVGWLCHFDPIVPWAGDYSGKDRVPTFFEAIFQSVDVEAFIPREWIIEGDTVVSLGEFGCKVKKTGKKAHTRWAFIWKFRDGKISAYEQFHDPALAAAFQ